MLRLTDAPVTHVSASSLRLDLHRQLRTRDLGSDINWPMDYQYYRCIIDHFQTVTSRLVTEILRDGFKTPLLVHGSTIVHGFFRFHAIQQIIGRDQQWPGMKGPDLIPCVRLKWTPSKQSKDLMAISISENWTDKRSHSFERKQRILLILAAQLLSTNRYIDCAGRPRSRCKPLRKALAELTGAYNKEIKLYLPGRYAIDQEGYLTSRMKGNLTKVLGPREY